MKQMVLSQANTVAIQFSNIVFPLVEQIAWSPLAYWEALSKPHQENTNHSASVGPPLADRWLVLEYFTSNY